MPDPDETPAGFSALIRREAEHYFRPNRSDRPWQLPFAIAVAAGLPMLAGALMGHLAMAALASIGAMTIVYLPRTVLHLRMASVMAAGFAMIGCYAFGEAAHLVPALRVPLVTLATLLVTLATRYYRVAPPGPIFFVMAATIGAYAPGTIEDVPEKLGIFAIGAVFSVAVAFLYSLHILRIRRPLQPQEPPRDIVGEVVAFSFIVAFFAGLSLALAELLGFDKPYWVPISCLAVMQGASLRLVWNRQVQRVVGTAAGLALTWALFSIASQPWHYGLAVMVLLFCVETIIVRNYALAAVFITPLAITLAESTLADNGDATALLVARLSDTVLGSVIGVAGGLCLYHPAIRTRLENGLARFAPRRDRI